MEFIPDEKKNQLTTKHQNNTQKSKIFDYLIMGIISIILIFLIKNIINKESSQQMEPIKLVAMTADEKLKNMTADEKLKNMTAEDLKLLVDKQKLQRLQEEQESNNNFYNDINAKITVQKEYLTTESYEFFFDNILLKNDSTIDPTKNIFHKNFYRVKNCSDKIKEDRQKFLQKLQILYESFTSQQDESTKINMFIYNWATNKENQLQKEYEKNNEAEFVKYLSNYENLFFIYYQDNKNDYYFDTLVKFLYIINNFESMSLYLYLNKNTNYQLHSREFESNFNEIDMGKVKKNIIILKRCNILKKVINYTDKPEEEYNSKKVHYYIKEYCQKNLPKNTANTKIIYNNILNKYFFENGNFPWDDNLSNEDFIKYKISCHNTKDFKRNNFIFFVFNETNNNYSIILFEKRFSANSNNAKVIINNRRLGNVLKTQLEILPYNIFIE